jgi:hypothetical protein
MKRSQHLFLFRDKLPHFSSLCSTYVFLSYSVIEVGFHCIYVFSSIFLCISLLYLGYIFPSCRSQNNPNQWYQSSLLLVISQSRSPTRSGYRYLGLELVLLEDKPLSLAQEPPMVEEKRDDKAGDPFKTLLEESLVRQRNEMMDNFFQILRRLPMAATEASSTRNHFTSATPFKVQVNFDIPLFEGQIDADALEKWLNLLEGYYSVQKKFDSEKITFTLLKSLPHVRAWWEGYWERYTMDESTLFGREPTWVAFVDALKEEFYPVRNYDDQYMRWTTLSEKRPDGVGVHQHISYLALKVGYQRL